MSTESSKCCYEKVVDDRYGLISGKDKLVFIKVGTAGTIYGYHNKYLEIALEINRVTGFAVAVSSNKWDLLDYLEEEICNVYDELGIIKDIIYIGISDGGAIGAIEAYTVPFISRMLLINVPLEFNLEDVQEGMKQYKGKARFVYGTKDEDYELAKKEIPAIGVNIEFAELEGVDHQFIGAEDLFKMFVVEFAVG